MSGADVVVDASKSTAQLFALRRIERSGPAGHQPGPRLARRGQLLEQVRDRQAPVAGRATSMGTYAPPPAGGALGRAAAGVRRAAGRRRRHAARVRYEDLVARPRPTLERALHRGRARPVRGGPGPRRRAQRQLDPSHGVAGSRTRFTAGRIELELDDAWRSTLPAGRAPGRHRHDPAPAGRLRIRRPRAAAVPGPRRQPDDDRPRGPAGPPPCRQRRAPRLLKPGWPLAVLYLGFPLWWALGLAQLIFFAMAAAMAVILRRQGPLRVPHGFGLWLLFLVWMLAGVFLVRADAPRHRAGRRARPRLPASRSGPAGTSRSRSRCSTSPTPRARSSTQRIVRLLGWMFVVTAGFGVLAVLAPRWSSSRRWSCCCPAARVRPTSCAPWSTPRCRRAATSWATCSRARPRPSPTPTPGATTSRSTCPSSSWPGSAGTPAGAGRSARSSWSPRSSRSPSRSTAGCGSRWRSPPSTPPSGSPSTAAARALQVLVAALLVGGVVFVSSPLYDTLLLRVETPHSNDRRAGTAETVASVTAEGSPVRGLRHHPHHAGQLQLAGRRRDRAVPPVRGSPARDPGLHVAPRADHRFRRHPAVPVVLRPAVPAPGPGAVAARRHDVHGPAGRGALLLRLRLARLGDVHRDDRDRADGPGRRPARHDAEVPSRHERPRPSHDASASYAAEVARLLWPEPWGAPHVTRDPAPARAAPPRRLRLPERAPTAPAGARPTCPAAADDAAAARRRPTRRSPDPMRRPARALGPLPGLRAGPLADAARPGDADPAADSIENHLAGCFGHRRCGSASCSAPAGSTRSRCSRSSTSTARLLGYAKVGHNDLTAALVRREAAALATVGGSPRPRPSGSPRLLHHGQWAGLEVLVMSPRSTDQRHEQVPPAARLAAMREVARLAGTGERAAGRAAGSGRGCAADAERLAGEPGGSRLRAAADAIERTPRRRPRGSGRLARRLGRAGTWAWATGCCSVWDWERFDAEVPLGFDGLHFTRPRASVPGEREARRQEEAFLRSRRRSPRRARRRAGPARPHPPPLPARDRASATSRR